VAPPSINTQPQSQTVDQGASAAFNVAADSTAPLSYQWQFNGVNISGATTNSLLLENVQPANAGNYVVMISNYGGSVTSSNAFLTVRPVLAAVQAGNNLIITWSGSYTLQSATNAAGPYLDVTGATSPYTNANVMPQQFYRLRN
jgi:Immunoglobulin domain